MRGKLAVLAAGRPHLRIIPAHAGQTWPDTSPAQTPQDHPRACGANGAGATDRWACHGSSPRMRGKPRDDSWPPSTRRIIPAHAGQTASIVGANAPWPDHPRACRANGKRRGAFVLEHGSSPRMRGKRGRRTLFHSSLRIIPAHAGQTKYQPADLFSKPDHPRACGANCIFDFLRGP